MNNVREESEPLPKEAKIAAKWWADRLRGDCKMESGDPVTRLIAPRHAERTDIIDVLSMLARVRELSPEQIDVFEATLATIVAETYCKTWDINRPMFGSACRTLAVDYGACDALRAAYQFAGGGQNVTVFPIKTIMWVNPGSVKVRYGYGGKSGTDAVGNKMRDGSVEFKNIERRYRLDEDQTAASRAAAQAQVQSAMVTLFGERHYSEGHDGGGAGWKSGIEGSGNGMPSSEAVPSDSPAWRRRSEKARREIAEHAATCRVRERAAQITVNEIQNDLKEIRQWANSLRKAKSVSGSTASTRREPI